LVAGGAVAALAVVALGANFWRVQSRAAHLSPTSQAQRAPSAHEPSAVEPAAPPEPVLPEAPLVKLPLSVTPKTARVVLTQHDGTRQVLEGPWSSTDARSLTWARDQRPQAVRIEAAGYRALDLPFPDGDGDLAAVRIKLTPLRTKVHSPPVAPHQELSYPWK
jgi:hypothetical protein